MSGFPFESSAYPIVFVPGTTIFRSATREYRETIHTEQLTKSADMEERSEGEGRRRRKGGNKKQI